MKSTDDYIRVLNTLHPSDEDIYTRDLLMKFVSNCNDYMEFLSPNTMNFLIQMSTTIDGLRIKNQNYPNSYFQSTLDSWNKMIANPTQLEQRQLEQSQIEQRTERLVRSRQKKDGFTNASILIYVAINLGLFLASLLLLLK